MRISDWSSDVCSSDLLIKITSPEFHLNFHDDKADKRIALMMLPQAQAQARVLEKTLVNDRGLFAARRPDGTFAEPRAGDQAVVLWGVSNLILAATSPRDDKSEEHTSELQSLMRISYAVFCLKKKNKTTIDHKH